MVKDIITRTRNAFPPRQEPPGDYGPGHPPIRERLHPGLQWLVAASLAWPVLLGALVFGTVAREGGITFLVLAFFTVVALGSGAVCMALRRSSRLAGGAPRTRRPGSLAAWLAGDFDAQGRRISGSAAAMQVLTPILSVPIGFTLLAVVDLAVRN